MNRLDTHYQVFFLAFYRPDLNVTERKLLKILMFVSIPVIVIGL
ncbi:MAG: hypothetical protein SO206_02385 [Bacilli bacterium]|nr:hypothetical protein [Bacilli bacterium]